MEQAKCWESILELISQLDRIQSAACKKGSHDKRFKSFRTPKTRENLPNLMEIHSPFRIISFPLDDLLDREMSNNGMIIDHHETRLIWSLAICDTNFYFRRFSNWCSITVLQENSYRFLTETCGLKILKSESGRTFRISNKIDISIMILLISDRALCCIIYASLWNIPGSGRSVRQSCLSSFERISIFFLNRVTRSKPIDSAYMIYR